MFWFAMLVVASYVVYVLRPDERRRALAAAAQFVRTALDAVRTRTRPRERDAFGEALSARTRGPYLTALVLLLNIVIFTLMVAAPGRLDDPDTLVRWGASAGPMTTNGEWWRLVTATVVHASVVQLVVDVAALAQAAVLVERMFGHLAFGGIYLVSAAFAAAIGLWGEPLAVTAGASAPIFGIHGLLVALVVRGTLQRSPVTIPWRVLRRLAAPAAVFAVYYAAAGGQPWTSGLATFVIGFAIGLALTRNVAERTPTAPRVMSLATAALAMAVLVVAPLKGMTDARAEIVRLIAIEDQTSATYRVATDDFKAGAIKADALARVIERSIVPTLQTARIRLNGVAGVPRQQQPLVTKADEYLRQRSESWALRATALRKSSMRLLREADAKESSSLDALEQLKRTLPS